jgi:acyl carrier protein
MEKSSEELDSTSIEKIVMKIIAGHLGLAVSELHPEDHLFNDLGADSLDQKEIIITIEEKFQIRLENEESKGMERIGDIVDIIQKHFQKQKENKSKVKYRSNQNL